MNTPKVYYVTLTERAVDMLPKDKQVVALMELTPTDGTAKVNLLNQIELSQDTPQAGDYLGMLEARFAQLSGPSTEYVVDRGSLQNGEVLVAIPEGAIPLDDIVRQQVSKQH